MKGMIFWVVSFVLMGVIFLGLMLFSDWSESNQTTENLPASVLPQDPPECPVCKCPETLIDAAVFRGFKCLETVHPLDRGRKAEDLVRYLSRTNSASLIGRLPSIERSDYLGRGTPQGIGEHPDYGLFILEWWNGGPEIVWAEWEKK